MKKIVRLIVAVSLLAVLCSLAPIVVSADGGPAEVNFRGTVKYINLEGGFWGILAEDGKKYDPVNLADEYKKDGLTVQVAAKVRNSYSIHMWGTIIEITAISKAE